MQCKCVYTEKLAIVDTLKSGQPPYDGHTVRPCLYIVYTFLPLKKGQPLNHGQNAHPQSVHYSEVPLYIKQLRVSTNDVWVQKRGVDKDS